MKLTHALNALGAKKSEAIIQFDGKPIPNGASSGQLSPTIFHEPWWLETTSDGAYREATVSCGGTIAARLPYVLSKTPFRMTVLGMPLMTHVLGPAFSTAGAKGSMPNHSKQIAMVRDLVAQLPAAAHISFRLHGGITNTLGFDAAGFSNNAGFTVEIAPGSRDALWRQMRDKTRNVIRRAEEGLTVTDTLDPERFLNFYESNLRETGKHNFYERRICANVITESLNRGVGRIISNSDAQGTLQSAIFTVWDQNTEYYFMSTRTSTSMNGATSLNIWTAIQHAAQNGLTFDMDGIHVKGDRLPNLLLLTGFGGTMKPRYVVRRTSAALQVARGARNLLRRTL